MTVQISIIKVIHEKYGVIIIKNILNRQRLIWRRRGDGMYFRTWTHIDSTVRY